MSSLDIEVLKKLKTVSNIRRFSKNIKQNQILDFVSYFEKDERKSVNMIVDSLLKKYYKQNKELIRVKAMYSFDDIYSKNGVLSLAGCDEVGRGPLAGPVTAATVVLATNTFIEGLNDSKKLSKKKRNELDKIIRKEAIAYSIAFVENSIIDEIGIRNANFLAMKNSYKELSKKLKIDILLVDGFLIDDFEFKQKAVIKGDSKSAAISAASIIAKVERDKLMTFYDALYPEYKFKSNKGYGSQEHIDAIQKYGTSKIHRQSFLKSIL